MSDCSSKRPLALGFSLTEGCRGVGFDGKLGWILGRMLFRVEPDEAFSESPTIIPR